MDRPWLCSQCGHKRAYHNVKYINRREKVMKLEPVPCHKNGCGCRHRLRDPDEEDESDA